MVARMEEIMWTLEYEADIASDLSAFHRIDDPMTLDGPKYFQLAHRLSAYSGVMAARAEKMRQDEREGIGGAHSAPAGAYASSADRPSRVADNTALAMLEADGWLERATEEKVVS